MHETGNCTKRGIGKTKNVLKQYYWTIYTLQRKFPVLKLLQNKILMTVFHGELLTVHSVCYVTGTAIEPLSITLGRFRKSFKRKTKGLLQKCKF